VRQTRAAHRNNSCWKADIARSGTLRVNSGVAGDRLPSLCD